MAAKLAVLGNRDFVEVFNLIGIEDFLVEDEPALKKTIETIYNNYAILIIPEVYLETVEGLKRDLGQSHFPIILPMPDGRGSLGISLRRLGQFIRKATGYAER